MLMDNLVRAVHRITSLDPDNIGNRHSELKSWELRDFYRESLFIREIVLPPDLEGGIRSMNSVKKMLDFLPGKQATLANAMKSDNRVFAFSDKPVLLDEISALLYLSDGINQFRTWSGIEHHFRCAPSAGALYPTVIYTVINNAEGLEPGIYYYHEKNHSLRLVRKGHFSDELCMYFEGDRMFSSAGCVFLYAAVFGRSKRNYGKRGYRYSFLDTGHVSANTAVTAGSLGLGYHRKTLFLDDRLNTFLGIDGITEAVLMGAAVGKIDAKGLVQENMSHEEISGRLGSLSVWKKRKESLDFTEEFHSKTARHMEQLGCSRDEPPRERGFHDPSVEALTACYRVLNSSAVEMISGRRSIREFGSSAITEEELSTFLFNALGENGDRTGRCLTVDGRSLFETYLYLDNIHDLEKGIYAHLPRLHSLELLGAGCRKAELVDALLGQRFVEQAAFVVFFTVELSDVPESTGPRIYRSALLNIGQAANNVCLAAEAMGWGACDIGAFFDSDVGALLGIDPEKEAVLLLVAVGKKL